MSPIISCTETVGLPVSSSPRGLGQLVRDILPYADYKDPMVVLVALP